MRKTFTIVLMMAVAVAAVPARLGAAGARPQQTGSPTLTGSMTGVAHDVNRAIVSNYAVQVRDVATGIVVDRSKTSSTGTFQFTGLKPGTYVVELINAAGKVVGLSSSIAVGSGAAVTVALTATTAVAVATSGAGFSMLGLGTAGTVAVVAAAAGVIGGVAVRSNKADASPSR